MYIVETLTNPNEVDKEVIIELFNNNLKKHKWTTGDIERLCNKLKYKKVIKVDGVIKGLLFGNIFPMGNDNDNLGKGEEYITSKKYLHISYLISEVKLGGTTLLKDCDSLKLDIYLNSTDLDTTRFYCKNGFVRLVNVDEDKNRIPMGKYINNSETVLRKLKSVHYIGCDENSISKINNTLPMVYRDNYTKLNSINDIRNFKCPDITGDIIINMKTPITEAMLKTVTKGVSSKGAVLILNIKDLKEYNDNFKIITTFKDYYNI